MKNCFKYITPARSALLVFALWCIAGIAVFRDYGLSWDEPVERNSGICSDVFFKSFVAGEKIPDEIRSLWGIDQYYGMAFQHILLTAEKICTHGNVNPIRYAERSIWHLRHGVTFLFVTLGLAVLYFSAKEYNKRNGNPYFPLFTVLSFMLMPRFFAESFYNVKDIVLLAGFMFGGGALMWMAKKNDLKSISLLALAAAFISGLRFFGIIFFLAGVVKILLTFKPAFPRRLARAAYFTLLFILLLTLFYPASYENSAKFFIDAVKVMSDHPWRGHVFFMGKIHESIALPKYYLIVWIAVTTPVFLLLCGICGSFFGFWDIAKRSSTLKRFILLLRSSSAEARHFQYRLFMLLLFFGGVLFLSLVSKVFYNGWRQFYFLAYPLFFLTAEGFCRIYQECSRKKFLRTLCAASAALFAVYIVVWNINAHPWQFCYFNILAGDPNSHFETDYWRLSQADAYRQIASYSKQKQINSAIRMSLVSFNALSMLSQEEKSYVRLAPPNQEFDFYISSEDKEFTVPRHVRNNIFKERYCPDLFGKDVFLYRIYYRKRN